MSKIIRYPISEKENSRGTFENTSILISKTVSGGGDPAISRRSRRSYGNHDKTAALGIYPKSQPSWKRNNGIRHPLKRIGSEVLVVQFNVGYPLTFRQSGKEEPNEHSPLTRRRVNARRHNVMKSLMLLNGILIRRIMTQWSRQHVFIVRGDAPLRAIFHN